MSDQPACRLYIVTPANLDVPSFEAELSAALAGGDVACVQLGLQDAKTDIEATARALLPICHARDVALLLADQPRLAMEIGADGVHLNQEDIDAAAVRTILGDDLILGVASGASRHLAMEAAEAGADYVALDASPDLISWWSGLMEVPCIAQGELGPESLAGVVGAGADFVAASDQVWHHPDGPGAGVAALNAAIAAARPT